jgi:hypothetical protein
VIKATFFTMLFQSSNFFKLNSPHANSVQKSPHQNLSNCEIES